MLLPLGPEPSASANSATSAFERSGEPPNIYVYITPFFYFYKGGAENFLRGAHKFSVALRGVGITRQLVADNVRAPETKSGLFGDRTSFSSPVRLRTVSLRVSCGGISKTGEMVITGVFKLSL